MAQLRKPTNKTNGVSVTSVTQKDAKALPPAPSFPILLDDEQIKPKSKKQKKKRHLGVEGGAGGFAFMAAGKKMGKKLFYATAVVALSVRAQGYSLSAIVAANPLVMPSSDGPVQGSVTRVSRKGKRGKLAVLEQKIAGGGIPQSTTNFTKPTLDD